MKKFIKITIIGLLTGFISGLFTSGGGLLLIPLLTKIFNEPEKKARATTIFCILPMVLTTAFFYHSSNYIHWQIGILCAIGGIIGSLLGSKLLNILKPKYLKIIFAMFLLYAGVKITFF